MKKIYVTILSFAVFGLASAQMNTEQRGKTPHPAQTPKKPVAANHGGLKTVIWSSDFSNPGDWTIGNSAGNSADWVITSGPSYWWGSLNSTSGGNQAAFDSDGYATAANQIANNAWIQAPSANCATYPAVAVTFEQFFYKWTGKTIVEVSNDGGTTWTDFEVNAGMGNNDQTTDPSTVTVDISSVAGGQADVRVRILYLSNAISDGGTDHTAGDGWDYGWIVDDYAIGTLPDNDIALIKGWHADIVNDYEYSMLPLTQVREMIPGVVVQNQGALQQTVDITCTITDGGGSTVNTTVVNHTSAVGAIDTVWFQTGFTPSAEDTYDVTFSIPADMEPSDDSYATSPLEVNTWLMAHDYGAQGAFGWNPQSTSQTTVDFAHSSHSWGNIYYPEVTQDIYGVDVNFAQGTTAGMYFLVRVQQIDPVNGIQGTLVWNNEVDYTVQAADIGSGITTIPFPFASTLTAGEGYIIDVLKVDGTQGNEAFYIGGSDVDTEDDDYSTVAYGPYGSGQAVNYWVSWGFAPYVRANFDVSLGVEENEISGVSVYPNPSEGIVNISNDNNDANTITVRNLDGKVILTQEANASTSINLSGFGAGVYFVKVSNEKGALVERVVIK